MKIKFSSKRIFIIAFSISLALILTFFLIQKDIKKLDKTRIALVDKVGNNYIFRGNNPFIKKVDNMVFARDELTNYFNEILVKKGEKEIKDYYLVDVSLLDLDHYGAIQAEKNYFKKNPSAGKMIHISTISNELLFGKFADSNFATKFFTKDYKIWLTNMLNKIHKIAEEPSDKPTIIYIHCNSGRDRSGLIAASYKLLFKNINLATALLQNISEAGRDSLHVYSYASHSYCLYVQETYNKPTDYCD